MKNFIYAILTALLLTITLSPAGAQAWERNTKVISLSLGASQFFHLRNASVTEVMLPNRMYMPLTGQFNFQVEFAMHKYVGVGFTIGAGGRPAYRSHYKGEVTIPTGMILNFHFYQLIADNSAKNLHADKLDIYAGINGGAGVAVLFTDNISVTNIFYGGMHAGVRYYITPRVGFNAEMGFGQSLVNAGVVFKL